jgi:hypothetical protein
MNRLLCICSLWCTAYSMGMYIHVVFYLPKFYSLACTQEEMSSMYIHMWWGVLPSTTPVGKNGWPPMWEANDWPTGPVRLCVEVKLQGLHRAPPQQLDQGSNRSLYCEKEEDLQGVEWNQGKAWVITAGFLHHRHKAQWSFPLSAQSLGRGQWSITLGSLM